MQQDYQLHYSFKGNSNKPIILFLHGFMGNSHEFDEAIELLSEEFYSLTVDLPAHGETQVLGGDECYTIANTAHALINLLDELKISQCFLVGYSMGGRLALYLMLHFPQRFPKVVLESASPGLKTEAERLERVKRDGLLANKLVRSDFQAFLLNWYSQPIFGSIKNHPRFQQLLLSRLQNNPAQLAKSLLLMGTGCQPSLWDFLKENRNPLLLLVGEDDPKFVDVNKQMAQLCECRLEVVSNCGHNIHFENTKEFVENVGKFFIEAEPQELHSQPEAGNEYQAEAGNESFY